MTARPFGLAVKAIVANEQGHVLVLRRAIESRFFKHKWDLPGGKIDPGERFDVGLAREVEEETGLTISLERVAGATEYDMPAVRLAVLFMEARRVAGDVRLSSEHDAYQWVPRADLGTVDAAGMLQKFLVSYSMGATP